MVPYRSLIAVVSCLFLFLLLFSNLPEGWATLAPKSIVILKDVMPAEKPGTSSGLVPSLSISMPIDHFNASDDRIFQNRYWLNDAFHEPGGPVFLLGAGTQSIPFIQKSTLAASPGVGLGASIRHI